MPQPDPVASSGRPPTLLALPSYLAGSVARIGNGALVETLRHEDLRLPQFAVLTALSDFGPLPPHEIARRLHADRSHISAYVDDLAAREWVVREPDAADRRRVVVHLTDSGRARLVALIEAAVRSDAAVLTALTPAEQRTYRELSMKILSTVDTGDETTPTGGNP